MKGAPPHSSRHNFHLPSKRETSTETSTETTWRDLLSGQPNLLRENTPDARGPSDLAVPTNRVCVFP